MAGEPKPARYLPWTAEYTCGCTAGLVSLQLVQRLSCPEHGSPVRNVSNCPFESKSEEPKDGPTTSGD